MTPPTSETTYDDPFAVEVSLDDYVRAFEQAYAHGGGCRPRGLPAAGRPPAPRGRAPRAGAGRPGIRLGARPPQGPGRLPARLPRAAADPEGLRGVAFEEFRLRLQAGQDPSAEEYLSRYGVRLDPVVGTSRSLGPPRRGRAFPGPCRPRPPGAPAAERGRPQPGPDAGPPPERRLGGRARPQHARGGRDFLGFRLIGELGRGAFGRVYLARQGDLADRPVALKVTADGVRRVADPGAAPARPTSCPSYSRHREGRARAVCMPYLGAITLRDVVEDLRCRPTLPDSGRGLLSSLGKSSVRKGVKAFGPPRRGPRGRRRRASAVAEARAGEGRARLARPTPGRCWAS